MSRGQVTGAAAIANFALALVVGAIMTWITDAVVSPLLDLEPATGYVATQSTDWLQIAVNNQPVMFLFYAFFSLIALAVFEREVLR